jgi:hypothetical protein
MARYRSPGVGNHRARSLCHSIWRRLFRMLLHDFREPGRPFCSDRRSNYDRSRGAVSRFLADRPPRLAHSRAHRKIAGRASCHSLKRISCGAPLRCDVLTILGTVSHFHLL